MPVDQKNEKIRAPRNRTIVLSASETEQYRGRIFRLGNGTNIKDIRNRVIYGDTFEIVRKLPEQSFDLLLADPPYNLTKDFGKENFRRSSLDDYERWLESWIAPCAKLL